MARVTIEDCEDVVNGRFELVAIAAERARQLVSGAVATIEKNNDKPTVLALREIAAKHLSVDALREHVITRLRSHASIDHVIDGQEEGENEDLLEEENYQEDFYLDEDEGYDESMFSDEVNDDKLL